jgi:TldD protein
MTNRREFLKKGTLVAGAIAAEAAFRKAHGLAPLAPPFAEPPMPEMDAATRDLMMEALNAAKMAGASYADVRIGRYLQNFVSTREQQITNVVDTDSIGAGVRALVNGTWGFAATRMMTKDGVASAARRAVAVAKATAIARGNAVELAPAPTFKDVSWKNEYKIDPWTIPVEQKADLLLKANAAALKAKNVKFVFSGLFFRKKGREGARL